MSKAMALDVACVDDVTIVTLSGEVDVVAVPVLRHVLDAMPAAASVVVDLGAVTFIDSAGLNVLVTQQRRVEQSGGSLQLDRPSRAVQRLIGIRPFDPAALSEPVAREAIAPVVSMSAWAENRGRRDRRSPDRLVAGGEVGTLPVRGY